MLPIVTAEEHGALNEILQGEYTQKDDGSFLLNVEAHSSGLVLENVGGLKKTVQILRTESAGHQAALKTFEGIDPEAARSAIQQLADLPGADDVDKRVEAGVKNQLDQVTKKHGLEVDKLVLSRDGALKQLESNLIIATLTTAIAAKKGNVDLLLPHGQAHTRMRALENGEYVAEVFNEDGARISPVGTGSDPMTIAELVDEMVDKFPGAFDSGGSTGGGMTGGMTGGNKPTAKAGTISRSDQDGMNQSLEGIASGKISVVD